MGWKYGPRPPLGYDPMPAAEKKWLLVNFTLLAICPLWLIVMLFMKPPKR